MRYLTLLGHVQTLILTTQESRVIFETLRILVKSAHCGVQWDYLLLSGANWFDGRHHQQI